MEGGQGRQGGKGPAARRGIRVWLLLGILAGATWGVASSEGWLAARADYEWHFPEDHWARPGYQTEWWYFTGHLTDEAGQAFGYQFTVFRVGLSGETPETGAPGWQAKDLVMGHAALSALPGPLTGGSDGANDGPGHRFSEVLYRASPLLGGFGVFPDPVLAWCRGPAGTESPWRLVWNGEGFDFEMADESKGIAFQLSTRPLKPMVFQGENGYSRKGEGPTAASQYYSFTQMATAGVVRSEGLTRAVIGESGMDKEFGSNQLARDQAGWDWFSLQLDDGREAMLYVLRGRDGSADFRRGTVVAKDGGTTYLGRDDFEVQVTGTWEAPGGGIPYPSGWRVTVPGFGEDLEVVPRLKNQENRSRLVPRLRYWEGAVELRAGGTAVGKGYVEMTGYGDSIRPAI